MTTEKEPTFCIDIRACRFMKQNQESLYKKLKLMREMGLTRFYTITDDTETIYADTEKKPEIPGGKK